MTTSRIEIFEQMLVGDPANTMIMFGLAKEYEKAGDDAKMIATLERYLAAADDAGNAYGIFARAYDRAQHGDKARETYRRGGERCAQAGAARVSAERSPASQYHPQ